MQLQERETRTDEEREKLRQAVEKSRDAPIQTFGSVFSTDADLINQIGYWPDVTDPH